ncbi:MAG: ATPase [Planctomycetota bacterium]
MHVLFLAPDTHVYNHGFLHGLKSIGAHVSAIGPSSDQALSAPARRLLDGYRACPRLLDVPSLLTAARELGRQRSIDRVETIDEPLVEPAAALREALGLPGLSVETARLCRDKVAMKDFLRRQGVPCAQSSAATSAADVRAFVERCGYPIVVKPIAGFGALQTYRVDDDQALSALLPKLKLDAGHRLALEEFVDGHEGFYDTICGSDGIRHDFAAHYYPSCLEAARDRSASPQIAVTNRVEGDGYRELREVGRRVIDALGIRNSGTHMEWFFGSKGLKFSEIGARPAGEKIWDMYRVANEFDVFREWALALVDRPTERAPSRRFAAGSVQVRPSRDGKIAAHRGLDAVMPRIRPYLYEYEVPAPGTPTKGLDKGWLVNTWFRLRHPDYDELRALMTFIGQTVQTSAES